MKLRIRGVTPPFPPQTVRRENFCQNQTIPTSKRIMNLPLEKETNNSAASL